MDKEGSNQAQAAREIIARCIDLNSKEKEAKKALETIQDELRLIKEQVKDLFFEMGVNSIKGKKTVYLSRQIWAGTAENATNLEVTEALKSLGLDAYVTYNHQSLSAYVREIAKGNTEWIGDNGQIVAEPEEIIAALPEPLNKLLKVTEKIDVRITN